MFGFVLIIARLYKDIMSFLERDYYILLSHNYSELEVSYFPALM